MEIGKVPENILKRSVFKKLTVKRPEVLVHSGVGEDCTAMDVGEHAIVLSTDPITGTADHIGRLAFHITANDIASSGAELVGMMVTIILPENSTEEDLKEIMQELSECTARYGVEIMGGHTEVSAVVNQPLVSVTGGDAQDVDGGGRVEFINVGKLIGRKIIVCPQAQPCHQHICHADLQRVPVEHL